MKKVVSSFLLLFLLSFIVTNETIAQEQVNSVDLNGEVEAIEEGSIITESPSIIKPFDAQDLKASRNTSTTLEDAYWYINEKGEEVQVTKIKVSQADRGKTYDISIDSITNEYEVRESTDYTLPPGLQSSINRTYFIGATYTTYDPISVALNRSRHELTWGGNASDAWKVSRNATAWAANPSPLGTHWYIVTNKYEGYVDGGKYINSSSYHSYYNMDFGSKSKRTDVWHRLNVRGEHSGYATITVERGKSGEGSSLLSFKLQTY